MKVLVADPVSEEGLAVLRCQAQVDVKLGLKPPELVAIMADYDAILVRSGVKVTADMIKAGKKLQVIGRAGVGVDNIDVEEATRCGVVVVNAPTGNTISAAEHTIALMLALARHIPQANASLKSGAWKRNDFMGTEVRGKTLGIIGLGKIGAEVARRAIGLEMKIIGFDPFVSAESARNMNVTLMPMKDVLQQADFITVHTPLSAQTKGLIGAKELALCKPSARLINCARGGIIDEEELARAVKEKKVAGAAIDVFTTEPATKSVLFESDAIIVTPHLAASTTEAQERAAQDVAEQVVDVLCGKPARYAVNAAFIPVEMLSVLTPFMQAATTLGRLASQLIEGQASSLRIKYEGEISNYDTNILKASILSGLLEQISDERVNMVNANLVAARRGLTIVEQKEPTCRNYASLITIEAVTAKGNIAIAGTVLRNEVHIVRLNNYWFDIVPTGGYFLFCDHQDQPGLIAAVGKVTGDADINISFMHLSRLKPRGEALMILALDEPLTEAQRQKVLAIPDINTARVVKL
jgi:D-3-phosphoglycerate dehydrogenase / 2-oxoglutarate reductase